MKKIKEDITTTKTITYRREDGLTITETTVNDKEKKYRLFSGKNLSALVLDLPKDYLKDGFPSFNELSDYVVEIKSLEDLDKYYICYIENASQTIFNLNKKIISKVYNFDYIGSLSEKVPDDLAYKNLIDKLKNHPFVLELSESKIPYYNASFRGQNGIKEMKIRISQAKYEELYKESKLKDKQFWSVRMSEAIKMSYDNEFNIYGDEISKLLSIYHKQDRVED